MQLDSIWRHSGLTMQKIKHADAGEPDRNISVLKSRRRREVIVKLGASICNRGAEGTRWAGASGQNNLSDKSISRVVAYHQVIIGIVFQFVLGQGSVNHPLGIFIRRNSVVRRNGSRRGPAPH